MKKNEQGAAILLLIAGVAVIFVGALLLLMLIGGGANSTATTGGDMTEDPTLIDPGAYQVGETGCLFFRTNPRVSAYLRQDPGFPGKLTFYSRALGYTSNDMMAMFNIECSFRFNVVNGFGCGGMFQLCPPEVGGPATATVGIRPRELAALSPSGQLPYLHRYFRAMGCHRDPPAAKTPTHAYLCVFLPAYRNYAPTARIWRRGNNPLHDVDNDGWIYKWEVDCNMTTSYAIGGMACGLRLPRCSRSKVR